MSPPYGRDTTGEEIAEDLAEHITNKCILITGVSPGGLGAHFAQTISVHSPKLIILAGQNLSKCQQTADEIDKKSPGVATRLLQLDLGSQESVRKAASEVNAYSQDIKIDVLVNNAGIMACPFSRTKEGLERQFGTTHIGHFLFTNLIIGKLLGDGLGVGISDTGRPIARVVSVASDGHRMSPIRWDWNFQVCEII
jgi:NAD(P)-dependent dehydrogenase (short-subunit alcohol dehydrogenase family)